MLLTKFDKMSLKLDILYYFYVHVYILLVFKVEMIVNGTEDKDYEY